MTSNISLRSIVLTALFAGFLSIDALDAFADSYQLTTLLYSATGNFYGIDDQSDFTVQLGARSTCGSATNAAICYETIYIGSSSGVFSTELPSLPWDDGSSCQPSLAGFSILNGLCNGIHFLASGSYVFPDNTELRGIWAGPNPSLLTSFISAGSIDGGRMNALGDAVFIDGLDNTLVFADDLSTDVTPEPNSLLLLGTGCLTMFGFLRRECSARQKQI